ncbi:hypothetical protein CNEO4_150051 [Clostridium neonatale]|nr:hypothetical protein CNEO2_20099 [Clostridium neonatale]CAI3575667.1 hypothetical protein CNEO4_150091 [Clostridium neonatale]CAI3577196.1 hypothetical protein CNEO2_190016 [Clostridium neonatale]CAI3584971.1 hypothetical protein CNEO2_140016 [Clostridium neonatale]CAI3595294.1 hypothetical protein CNEO2_180017 [Clostridium neonatale]
MHHKKLKDSNNYIFNIVKSINSCQKYHYSNNNIIMLE